MGEEWLSFVVAALAGSMVAGVGDLLWWVRRRLYARPGYPAVLLSLFILAWVILAAGLYVSTGGALRSSFFLGTAAGFWLYRAWASPVHRRILSRLGRHG